MSVLDMLLDRFGRPISTMKTVQMPPLWGNDDLSAFLDLTEHNMHATFYLKKREYNKISNIDRLMFKLLRDMLNPKDIMAPIFLMRAHSAFRAGCRLALSGQMTEAFVLLRSVIEYSLYALHINKSPKSGYVWFQRHDSDQSNREMKNEFKWANIMKTLAYSDHKLYHLVNNLYKKCIDLGAHPNERGITSSGFISKSGATSQYNQIYAHDDGPQLRLVLTSSAQVGVSALLVFRHIFPARFELLGINAELRSVQEGL